MAQQLPPQDKKKRLSFFGKIFKSSKKSVNKDTTADDSFRRQCALYHSFHTTNVPQDNNTSNDEGGNFTTLENSAFMEMHKDAGIIFLNKNSITSNMAPREEDIRHVQFVPTPMNKYYKVDVKSSPAKGKKNEENKENMFLNKTLKPTRPILRLGKSRENLSQKENASENQNFTDTGKLKLNVTYVDGPQVKKTPTIPRTSTKMALLDRKNGSLPFLNISGIAKYGSLPRPSKTNDERYRSGNGIQVPAADSYDIKTKLFFPPVENRHLGSNHLTESEFQRKYLRKTDKNGCFSIPDLPRHIEQRKHIQQERIGSNQNVTHRFSMGEGRMMSTVVETRSLDGRRHDFLKEHSQTLQSRNIICATGQQERFQQCQLKETTNAVLSKQVNLNRVTCQLPNRAINEIGLPTKNQTDERSGANKFKNRTESPHYIQLAETYSSGKYVKQNKPENVKLQPGYYLKNSDFIRPNIPRQSQFIRSNGNPTNSIDLNPHYGLQNHHLTQTTMSSEEYSHFVSQARMQAIRSSMYSHRRKSVNKICKYKSKECEDGFSSMADDECSFNCSCSSCLAKFSRDYKKNMNRNTLHLNADDKLFFITTDEHGLNERAPLATVLEVPLPIENVQKISEDGKINTPNKAADTTWYDCNDTLCKTPNKNNEEVTEGSTALLTPRDCQEDRLVESIYENITQIINSATKRTFKKQDIQTMFSTPLSRSKVAREIADATSGKRVSRALFASADNLSASQSKQVPSSMKSPIVFSDSVILLQEIFQKLSQECKELLQPTVSSTTPVNHPGSNPSDVIVSSSGSKYVNDLVKNLRSKEISEGDFASIIGGIAQNIFLEAKLKQTVRRISNSTSLPDLTKGGLQPKIQSASSVENITKLSESHIKEGFEIANSSDFEDRKDGTTTFSSATSDSLNNRSQPDGWSRSPTTTIESSTGTSITGQSNCSNNDSRTSESSESQLLEMAIRLGMGLSPISKDEKTAFYSASPAKATKYKSRDVLSGKGKQDHKYIIILFELNDEIFYCKIVFFLSVHKIQFYFK